MNKTSINLKNCYGIPALTYEFDFTEHDSYVECQSQYWLQSNILHGVYVSGNQRFNIS